MSDLILGFLIGVNATVLGSWLTRVYIRGSRQVANRQ